MRIANLEVDARGEDPAEAGARGGAEHAGDEGDVLEKAGDRCDGADHGGGDDHVRLARAPASFDREHPKSEHVSWGGLTICSTTYSSFC